MAADPATDQRYLVVSSDGHAGADVLAYREYLDPTFHDDFDRWATDFVDPWVELDPGLGGRKMGVSSGLIPTNWDSDARERDLEAEGIVGEVLFPNTAPPFFPSGAITAAEPSNRDEYERRFAGVQAHNRWLVDFCAELPGRRAGVAQIFLNDVGDAVKEIEWVAQSGLTGGVLIPAIDPGSSLPPLHSDHYEPVWAACADLGLPVGHHGILAAPAEDHEGSGRSRLIAMIDFPFYSSRTLWQLIMAGVFDRHPTLKFVMTELPIGWIPSRLALLDSFYDEASRPGSRMDALNGQEIGKLSMPPSEYFARNCFVGASFMLPPEAASRHKVGVDNIMWGADYPHGEGTAPYTTEALRASFADVPTDECRRIFGETAAKIYNLDMNALRAAADKVGPTVEEVARPLGDDRPRIPEDTNCRVFDTQFAARY